MDFSNPLLPYLVVLALVLFVAYLFVRRRREDRETKLPGTEPTVAESPVLSPTHSSTVVTTSEVPATRTRLVDDEI